MPTLIAAVVLALIHAFAGKMRFLEGTPRSRWLSFAGGISVAYVIVHLLPELSHAQQVIERAVGEAVAALENHVYLVALLGLVVFYGLERLATHSQRKEQAQGQGDGTSAGVFWLHMGSFGIYNALIGYLLVHRERPGLLSLVLFSIAMGLHFVVTDFGLREHHKSAYGHIGRWILVAAVVLGWAIGVATEVTDAVVAVLLAFLAGGVILNVLKEELPAERESRFWAFAVGAAAYTVLLLTL